MRKITQYIQQAGGPHRVAPSLHYTELISALIKHLFYCKYHGDLQEGNSPWIALFGGMHSYTNMTLGLGLPIMLCLVKWNVYLTASVIKKPSSHLDPDLNLSCLERNIFFRQTETKTKIIVKNKNNQVLSQNHFPLDYFLLCLKSDQLRDKQNKERKTLTKTNFLLVYTISFFILERKRKLSHCK